MVANLYGPVEGKHYDAEAENVRLYGHSRKSFFGGLSMNDFVYTEIHHIL